MDENIFMVEALVEDFWGLEEELAKELAGNDLGRVMEVGGYWEQLGQIRQRALRLRELLRGRLEHLQKAVASIEGSGRATALSEQIIEANMWIGQLQAVLERLETLVSLIEQRVDASESGLSKVIGRVKGWLSTLVSWVERISRQLWSLLSQYLKPKEWKLGGKVGTGPLGLADVSVELTFGP